MGWVRGKKKRERERRTYRSCVMAVARRNRAEGRKLVLAVNRPTKKGGKADKWPKGFF